MVWCERPFWAWRSERRRERVLELSIAQRCNHMQHLVCKEAHTHANVAAPKVQKWHCIDFAVMRRKDRKRCFDAAVMRGAECHTDHQLLRIKVGMTSKWLHTGRRKQRIAKYDVAKLQSGGSESTVRVLFRESVSAKAKETWKVNSSIEEKWCASALTETAKEVLGTEQRRHPDWFIENMEPLEPLFHQRNELYLKYLSSRSETDRHRFAEARRLARQATRAAKNAWFQGKAEEAQKERFGGKKVWQCIKDMQRGRRGLVLPGQLR